MGHFAILSYLIILIVGVCAAFYMVQISRFYTYPFLKPLTRFIIFYNLVILIDLSAMYSCINLLRDGLLYKSSVYAKIFGPLSSYFFILMAYALIKTIMGFLKRSLPRGFQTAAWTGFFLLSFSYAARIILNLSGRRVLWLPMSHGYLIRLAALASLAALLYLLVRGYTVEDKKLKRIILPFGLFYLFELALLVVLANLRGAFTQGIIAGTFLLVSLFPFFWLKLFFFLYHGNAVTGANGQERMDGICDKYGISRREREIAELILLGKSNREIESALYISLNTVKNHVYNLYQKLGVKSRAQMVKFVLDYENRL
jgi:DNA-binding CsgD family transcriptional regulator